MNINQEKMPEELGSIDPRLNALKLLAAFGVVIVHSSMIRASNVDLSSLGWWAAALGDAAGRIGSATFAMVAGAVFLARSNDATPMVFVGKRLRRLLPVVLFWSVFYFFWRAWLGEVVDERVIIRDLVLGAPMYHLWFMFMMLGMYFLIPILRCCVMSDKESWVYIVGVSAVFTWIISGAQTFKHIFHSSFLELVPFFIVYLFAGYYFSRKIVKLNNVYLFLISFVCVFLMALGLGLLYPLMGDWAAILFYSNRSPFAMALTFCVFLLFIRMPVDCFPAWVNKLGPFTLGVYVSHPFFMWVFSYLGWPLTVEVNSWFIQGVLVFFVSMFFSVIFGFFPVLRRLVS